MRRIVYAICFASFFVGCATGHIRHVAGGNPFADAALIAEQRIELERQSRIIADLERIIQSGAKHLDEAERYLGELEQGNIEFAEWLRRVDEFVRRVIEVKRELETIQPADGGADAGEG